MLYFSVPQQRVYPFQINQPHSQDCQRHQQGILPLVPSSPRPFHVLLEPGQ